MPQLSYKYRKVIGSKEAIKPLGTKGGLAYVVTKI